MSYLTDAVFNDLEGDMVGQLYATSASPNGSFLYKIKRGIKGSTVLEHDFDCSISQSFLIEK